MARLMQVLGIVLAAIGLALAVAGMASPGQMQVYGLTLETAAILLTGGILALGLGGMINALDSRPVVMPDLRPPQSAPDTVSELPAFRPRSFDSLKPAATAAASAGAAIAAAETAEATAPKISVTETIEALEQAKSDIKAALGESEPFESTAQPLPVKLETPQVEPKPPVDEQDEQEGAAAEPGLFVVEEQTVRGKPARLLSDGTVEAETDEGWMRFENMEHLNEYLDSLAS